jgi:hypothetical protein
MRMHVSNDMYSVLNIHVVDLLLVNVMRLAIKASVARKNSRILWALKKSVL